jgi:hypothetical protein
LPYRSSAAEPPGPGFPSHPPSVWIVIFFRLPPSAMLKASAVPSSQSRNFAATSASKWNFSAHVARIKKVNEVTTEAWNSPNMIFKHYRELVTEKEAEAWFGVSRML